MSGFDLSGLTDEQRPTGVWAAALLRALARDEAAGRRTSRLTEPKLDTWSRFRGRSTASRPTCSRRTSGASYQAGQVWTEGFVFLSATTDVGVRGSRRWIQA